MALSWPSSALKTVFGPFAWPFCGPHLGEILRIRALEKSSDRFSGVADVRAKSGSSGSCRLFLHFLGEIAVQ